MNYCVNIQSLSGINKPLSDLDAQFSVPLSGDGEDFPWKTLRKVSKSNLNDPGVQSQLTQSQGIIGQDASQGVWDAVRSPDTPHRNNTPTRNFYNPPTTSKGFDGVHATPLLALQFRDLKVLRELFDREGIGDIITNVQERLAQLYPEPCWDETPYDFLRDFL